jgi:hypothetical protein
VDLLARAGPALAVIVSTVMVARLHLDQDGVRVVGACAWRACRHLRYRSSMPVYGRLC